MNAGQFTKDVLNLDNDILFAGIVEKSGHINTSSQRVALDNYLKGRNAELIYSQFAHTVDLRKMFESSFGNLNSIWYEYSTLSILLFPVKDHILFILMNKTGNINGLTQKIYNLIKSKNDLDLYSV